MGAIAWEQTPMTEELSNPRTVSQPDLPDGHVDAAREAVRLVPSEIAKIGGTREEGVAIAEALRLLIEGGASPETSAWRKLTGAGFPSEIAYKMIETMQSRLAREAA